MVTLGTGERVELASRGRRLSARAIDIVAKVIIGTAITILCEAAYVRMTEYLANTTSVDISIYDLWMIGGITSDGFAQSGSLWVTRIFSGLLFAIVTGCFCLFECRIIAKKGQTLGDIATRIRVVRSDNGLSPRWSLLNLSQTLTSFIAMLFIPKLAASFSVYVSGLLPRQTSSLHGMLMDFWVILGLLWMITYLVLFLVRVRRKSQDREGLESFSIFAVRDSSIIVFASGRVQDPA